MPRHPITEVSIIRAWNCGFTFRLKGHAQGWIGPGDPLRPFFIRGLKDATEAREKAYQRLLRSLHRDPRGRKARP